jgi:cell division septation protein DedD
MDDLTKIEFKTKKKLNKKSNYILVISDFYYEDSARNLMEELVKKNKMNNISVEKINNKKYRLFAGPFENFNALKTTYISLNKLGFENLNIYKE